MNAKRIFRGPILWIVLAVIAIGLLVDLTGNLTGGFSEEPTSKVVSIINGNDPIKEVVLVDMVAMGRIGFALARDGLLPPVFRKIHPTWNTPVLMTSLTVAVVAVLAAFVPLADLAEMVSIGTLFAFLVVSIAVPVLRVKQPDMERPFRTPLSPVLPVVSGICCVLLMSNLAVETWLRFLVWLVLGLIIYVTYSRTHARLADPARFDSLVGEERDVTGTSRD